MLTKSSIGVRYLLQSCLKNIFFVVCTPSRVYLLDHLLCPILPFFSQHQLAIQIRKLSFLVTQPPLPCRDSNPRLTKSSTAYQVAVYEAAGLSMGQLAFVNA